MLGEEERESMLNDKAERESQTKATAAHALACGRCRQKVRILVQTLSGPERWELLTQIERHHHTTRGGLIQ